MAKGFFYLYLLLFILGIPVDVLAAGIFIELDSSAPWHVSQKNEYVFEADVKSQDGDFAVGKTALNFKKEYKHSSGLPVDLSLSLGRYVIHDETAVDLPASLQSKGVTIGTKMPMPFARGDRFFLGLDFGAHFQSAKDHAFQSGTFRSKNRVYGIYKKNDFIFVAGALFQHDYEDNAAMPFLGFQYILNDRWSLHFLSTEPYISYRMNDRTTVKWIVGSYHDEFEVAEGGRKGDIVKISEAHAGMGLEYELLRDVFFQTQMGWAFARKYEYLKNGGKVVPDDSLFLSLSLKAKF